MSLSSNLIPLRLDMLWSRFFCASKDHFRDSGRGWHHAISAVAFGAVKRLIRALEHVGHQIAPALQRRKTELADKVIEALSVEA